MDCLQLFNSLDLDVLRLSTQINATHPPDFINQWKQVFSCAVAKERRGVVYVWTTVKPIPRLKGGSNIVYIGQTGQTLYSRHHRYAGVESSPENISRYAHIIRNFGPLSFHCAVVDQPREYEKKMLSRYFKEHLELPPVNAGG